MPGYAWQRGLTKTATELQNLPDQDFFLIKENNLREAISMLIEGSFSKSDDKPRRTFIDAKNLHGWAMSQPLLQKVIRLTESTILETLPETDDYAE